MSTQPHSTPAPIGGRARIPGRWFAVVVAVGLAVVGLTIVSGNDRTDRVRTCQALLDDATGYAPLNPPVSAEDYARIYGRELKCRELVESGQIKGRLK